MAATFKPGLVDLHSPNLRSLLGPLSLDAERAEAARKFLKQHKNLDRVAAGRAAAIDKVRTAAPGQPASGTGNKRMGAAQPKKQPLKKNKHAGGAGN